MSRYLITGATRGIGRALVELLADHELYLLARRQAPIDELCSSMPDATGRAVDLRRPENLAAALDGWIPDRLDGIVHNAGVGGGAPIADQTPPGWVDAFSVNVFSVGELTRLCLPALRAGRATVVAVNSGSGLRVGAPGSAIYSGTKFALRALADSLRIEEPELRVTTVFPGRVDTDMQRELQASIGRDYDPDEHLRASTVAGVIAGVLDLPRDGFVPEVSVNPKAWTTARTRP